MGKLKASYNWHGSGKFAMWDGSTFETVFHQNPIFFYDDFNGPDVVIPAAASPESGCKWAKKIVGSGPPTVAQAADTVNGYMLCSLEATSEKQEALLYMNDSLNFSVVQGLIFEARVAMTTLGTGNGLMQFGVGSVWVDGAAAYRAIFKTTAGGGVMNCNIDDNATDTAAAAGVTILNTDYKVYRIDCSNYSSIKFFIDGVRVAASTTFAWAASAANSKVQPYLGVYKSTGTGTGVMAVDYVKVWQARA